MHVHLTKLTFNAVMVSVSEMMILANPKFAPLVNYALILTTSVVSMKVQENASLLVLNVLVQKMQSALEMIKYVAMVNAKLTQRDV